MRQFKIGFSKSSLKAPILSWLIRLYENTPFSHTYLEFDTKKIFEDDTIFQSSKGMVNYMSKKFFLSENDIVEEFEFEIPLEVYMEMRVELHASAGIKYAFMQNIGILYTDFMRLFGKRVKNPWKKGYNCSELVYKHVIRYLYPDFKYDPETVTPKDVYNMLKEKQDGR